MIADLTAFLDVVPTWKAPSWVTVIGILITWIGGVILVLRYRMDLRKARDERAAALKKAEEQTQAKLAEFVSDKVEDTINEIMHAERTQEQMKQIIRLHINDTLIDRAKDFATAESIRYVEKMLAESDKAIDQRIDDINGRLSRVVSYLSDKSSLAK